MPLLSAEMAAGSKHAYLPSLQVFRGIAALGVVIYHAGLFTERQTKQVLLGGFYHLGELGVDFFFVLSGFIIAFAHGAELGQPDRAPRYLCRRFFRVYPLLFILTTVKLIMEVLAARHGGAPQDMSRILSSYLLLPPPEGSMPVITAAWTLTHEALFYALFLLALLLGKRAAYWLFGGWMGLVILFNCAGLRLHGMPRLIFDAHNVEFILGAAAYMAFLHRDRLRLPLAGLGILASVDLLAGVWIYDPASGMDQTLAVRLLLGSGFALLILLTGLWEQRQPPKVWPQWACWLGDASYSIYLGHSLILLTAINAGSRYLPGATWPRYAVAFASAAAAVALCGLLWLWVERPLLRWSRRFS